MNLVKRFCQSYGIGPNGLVELPKSKIEGLIQVYADGLASKGHSRSYVNTVLKRLRTFFTVNGFKGERRLELKLYYQPTRYRKRPEHIPSKSEILAMSNAANTNRNRAAVLGLWSSGLRVSSFCALNYGDVSDELSKGEANVLVRVYPEMRQRVPAACKGEIPYYSFISQEATEALKTYLRERSDKYGEIEHDHPLFHSNWNLYPRETRTSRRLDRRGVGLVVKRSARLAGIKDWKHVTPHCLRKAFESVLRSPTLDGGRLDKGTQEFLFGHVLPGSMDYYYDKGDVEFHRDEYRKLDFTGTGLAGRSLDRLIDVGELERYFSEGWMFVSKVSGDKVVVRRRW